MTIPPHIKFAVFFSLSGYRHLGDGGTDRGKILYDGTLRIGPGRVFYPFGGGAPKDPQIRNF